MEFVKRKLVASVELVAIAVQCGLAGARNGERHGERTAKQGPQEGGGSEIGFHKTSQ